MNNISFSILLVLIGIFVGSIGVLIINYIRGSLLAKKTEKMLEKARKEAAITMEKVKEAMKLNYFK